MKEVILWICCFGWMVTTLTAQTISKSFEIRYFTDSIHATGTNGFNGDSSIFSTEDRLIFLNLYRDVAKQYYNNPALVDLPILTEEVKLLTNVIPDFPQPTIRNRMLLTDWKWKSVRKESIAQQEAERSTWLRAAGAKLERGRLYATQEYQYAKEFSVPQTGQFTLQWDAFIPRTPERAAFVMLDELSNPVILLGVTSDGSCFYKSRLGLPIGVAQFSTDTLVNFKLLVDVEAGRFSLFLNNEIVADFVRSLSEKIIHRFFIQIPKGAYLDNIYGINFERTGVDFQKAKYPFPKGKVLIEQDFDIQEEIGDLGRSSFEDANWLSLALPINSGDRFRNTDLILRKTFTTPSFEQVHLHLSHVAPNTEIWLDGQVIYVHNNAKHLDLDLSTKLGKNRRHTLMLRMKGNPEGWYLSDAWLDFKSATYIEKAQVYTANVNNGNATLNIQANLISKAVQQNVNGLWQGRVNVRVFPFTPTESTSPIANQTFPVTMRLYREELFAESIVIPKPKLWSLEQPNLYKVVISLVDAQGQYVDDFVLTTGIRTISQKGGVFRLNEQPMLLNGVNLSDYVPFGVEAYDAPIHRQEEWLVRLIQSAKKMNANVLRIKNGQNVDISHLASLCDYFGLLLIYQTDPLPKEKQIWSTDFDAIQANIVHLRHHPSIVMWQAADELMFYNYFQDAVGWMTKFYETVMNTDPSRLVSLTGLHPNFANTGIPNSDGSRLYDNQQRRYRLLQDSSVWIAPNVARGNTHFTLSAGKNWNDFRNSPVSPQYDTLILNYLASKKHIYVDFNAEAIEGQENPITVRATPHRYSEAMQSPFIAQAIGQPLTFEEWELSQSYQAFSLAEALRKKRWLGYDGLIYNQLSNGADPTSLLDARGYMKLAYHTAQTAFQTTLAGSKTTDMAYLTKQTIPIFINHVGTASKLSVKVTIKDIKGKIIQTQQFPVFNLPTGNTTLEVGRWTNSIAERGWYVVEYEVMKGA